MAEQGNGSRFLIIGAGAIGSVFGGFLARAGNHVTLCDRETPHIKAARDRGLTVTGIWGEFNQRSGLEYVTDKSGLDPSGYDYACIAVKSYNTAGVLDEYAESLAASRFVVSLQNGVGNVLEIADRAGAERTIGVRIIFGAELPEPGTARVTVKADDLALGWVRKGPAADGDGAGELARIFNLAGLRCRLADAVVPVLWAKALYNSALNGLGAVLGVPYGELLASEASKSLIRALMAEAFAVLDAEGLTPRMPWPDSESYVKVLFEELIPPTAAHRASMLQDIELGRRTEIDALNGYIADLAAGHGLDARTNQALRCMIRFLEEKAAGA